MDAKKPKQVRVYLSEDEIQMLTDLVAITGMKDTAVLSLLCRAALKASKEVDYRLPLALKFSVAEPMPEPKTKPTERIRR